MKLIKRLSVLVVLLLCAINAISQTYYYYNTTKTFNENGYRYQCDKPDYGLVTLYNKDNVYTYLHYEYKDGSPLENTDTLGSLFENDNWTKQKCDSIVNNAFSPPEKQRVKGKKLDVTLTIDSSTGKVIEVDFCFFYSDLMGTIPVSTYRKIELELKEKIWFTLTETGKKLTFVQRGWMHTVE